METRSVQAAKGLTLIELLVVLAIIAILATVAAPAYSELILNQKARQMQWQWRTFLGQARSAAVNERRWVTVCPMASGQCTTDLSQTWAAFYDDDLNNELDTESERIIAQLQPDEDVSFVMYKGNTTLSYFRYRSSGMSGNLRGFTVCPNGVANKRAFHLTSTHLGRIRFAKDSDGDGLVDRRYQGRRQNVTC